MKSEYTDIIHVPVLGQFSISRYRKKIAIATADCSVRASLTFEDPPVFAWDGTIGTTRLRAKQMLYVLEFLLTELEKSKQRKRKFNSPAA